MDTPGETLEEMGDHLTRRGWVFIDPIVPMIGIKVNKVTVLHTLLPSIFINYNHYLVYYHKLTVFIPLSFVIAFLVSLYKSSVRLP